MEITLKDQSVIDIGKTVGDNVNSLTGGASTALVPAGGGAVAPAGGIATPMNPFDSMMVVLSDIRDGIYSLVDKFSESVSIQQDAKSDAAMAQDLAQVADAGEGASDDGADPAPKQSFFSKAKNKVKELLGAGGFKGLLIKGGLIFGLLGIAKLMQKYGKEIAEKVAPIVDGIKAFFSAFTDDIGPLFDKAVAMVKDAIGGLLDIFKGLFTGDASTFLSGVKKIFVDFPIKLVSYIGDAFFSLIENALAAFGIESEMVTDIKMFFRQLPEKISELFENIGKFFTETIPQKLEEIKTSITNFFNDKIVTPIKGLFTDIGNFFTVTVPEKFTEISNKVTSFFTDIVSSIGGFFTDAVSFVTTTIPEKISEITKGISDKFTKIKDKIIDFAMAPFRKIGELFDNLLIGILESVENIPFIGGKAKEMKEAIIAKRETAAAEGEVNQIETGNLIDYGFDNNNNLTMNGDPVVMGTNSDAKQVAVAAINDGTLKEDEAQIVPTEDGFMVKRIVPATIESVDTTTGGATGGEINTESAAAAAASGSGGNGGVVMGGNNTQVSNSSVVHNAIDEKTGVSDNTLSNQLND